MKKYSQILFILFIFITSKSQAIGIVALVNDQVITDYDVDARISLIKVISPEKLQGKKEQERKNMALLSLINDEAKMYIYHRLKMGSVENDAQRVMAQMLKGKTSLPHFSYPMEYYKDFVKTQIAWSNLIQSRIAPNTSLADGEVENYYETLKSTPLVPSRLHLSQIIVEDAERLKAVYQEVKNIRGCTSFSAEAPNYGATGSGDMGWVNSQNLALPLQHIFSAAPTGVVLAPMPIGQGGIIFMICARQQKNLLKDAEMKKRIEYSLLNQKVEVLGEQYLQNNRDQMYIDIKDSAYDDVKEMLF
ncbi:MAG: peptidylprolyl isomerase [Alphaproteobacteria bacterium]|nr:peptidylprolyl isomerase [Alphaproteobacteria bacterium]